MVDVDFQSCALAVKDANIDSGCSMSMNPYLSNVQRPTADAKPIRLADHSAIEATHRGFPQLPLSVPTKILTLVVPSLHEPLLAVSGLCNQGLTVVFGKDVCKIYTGSVNAKEGSLAGHGYRKGNLYYLQKADVSSHSAKKPPRSIVNTSFLDSHNHLSHIGVCLLKRLLKTLNITPSILKKINVQKCTVCVQSKIHRRPLTS
jgi:hypothetical protein